MAPPKKLQVQLPNSLRNRLESLAQAAGVDLEAYASTILSTHAVGFPRLSHGGAGGRPITVQPDDLPADIERASNVTGFTGIAKIGRLFTSRAGRQLIGKFSSAELAASVRYYALLGFRLGRGSSFAEAGIPIDEAVELAARAGFSFEAPPAPSEGSGTVDPRQMCIICHDTGKASLPPFVERVPGSSFTVSHERWWPCECPAGAGIEKPTEWDVTGKPVQGAHP